MIVDPHPRITVLCILERYCSNTVFSTAFVDNRAQNSRPALSPLYADWNSTFRSQGYRHLNLDFLRVKQL